MSNAVALSVGAVMDLLKDQALLLWAVWRSLDDRTGSFARGPTLTAPERLAKWSAAGLDDRALSQAVHEIYVSTGAMRQPGEPWVKLCSKNIKGKVDLKDLSTITVLLASCGTDLVCLRDQALLQQLWHNHWAKGDRSISATVQMDIADAPSTPVVMAWVQAAAINSGPLFRDVVDGTVKDYGLGAEDANYVVKRVAVAAGLAEWASMLWVSWTDHEIDIDRASKDLARKPHLEGRAILTLVRYLMESGVAPPLPPRYLPERGV